MKKLPKLVLGLVALLAVGGCWLVDDISFGDPPELFLDLGPPRPPHISKVEITNGDGMTVMSGSPDRNGELEARPDLTDLDGTLTIKSTWSNGNVTTHTVTHMPDRPISLTYNRDLRRFDVTERQIPSSSTDEDAPDGRGD